MYKRQAEGTAATYPFTGDFTIDVISPNCSVILKTSETVKNNISLYPNPTKKILFVNGMDLKQAKVFDASGKLIPVKNNGNDINVDNVPKGTYLIQLEDKAGNLKSDKFIKN